jgi:hypothetical protein
VYKAYILILLGFLVSCKANEPVDLTEQYGDEYFQMDCAWADPDRGPYVPIWRCTQDVTKELITGHLVLQLSSPVDLYFCGENLHLQSDIGLYDNLISYLTEDNFDCLHITEDETAGNMFDWAWEGTINTLQLIWRPETAPWKMVTLVLQEGEFYEPVIGTVYYKILTEE